MGVVNEPGSRICQLAGLAALVAAGALVLAVIGAFAYDVRSGLGGLIAVFLLASALLLLVATLDLLAWRHVAAGPSLPLQSAGGATTSAAAGLALLLLGALFTVIEVGVGGEKNNDFAVWTSTAVGYLLLAALGAQIALLVLSWLMRPKSVALGG